ncbi:MAG: hypothetical protein P8182_07825 [Deltaproteobacteria bacterium]
MITTGTHATRPVCSRVGLVKYVLSRSICDAFILVPGIRWVVKVGRDLRTLPMIDATH